MRPRDLVKPLCKRTNRRVRMAETKPPWPMTEAVWRKYPNGLGGRWPPRSAHKLIDRCCDQKVSIVAKPKEARPDLREGSEAQVPQIQVSAGQAGRAAPEETPGAGGVWPRPGRNPGRPEGAGPSAAGLWEAWRPGPGLGAARGRVYRVGVTVEVGLGGGA